MIEIMEILKYTLPAIVVLLCAIFVLRAVLKYYLVKLSLESKRETNIKTIQIRLQAYERIVLFLERISPQQLVLRVDAGEMDLDRYHRILLQTVREEFEHNIAQQIYITAKAWELVKSAKESVLQIINRSKAALKPDASAHDLAAKIIEIEMLEGNKQMGGTILFIKREVMELF